MKTKKYEWVGASKVIPNHGVAAPGKTIILPIPLGESFVRQELAIEFKAKQRKPIKEEVK